MAVAAGMLVAGNAAVFRLSRDSNAGRAVRLADDPLPVSDLFLGNSLMEAAADLEVFARAKPGRPLSLAMGATMPAEHALLLDRQASHAGANIYYGFFNTQLTDDPRTALTDLLGNRAVSFQLDGAAAARYYSAGSRLDAWAFAAAARVPWVVNRGTVWGRVESLRRTAAEVGMPSAATNRFGRVRDFALAAGDLAAFRSRCQDAVAAQSPLSRPVADMLSCGARDGCKVFVIEMPMPAAHRDTFYATPAWRRYKPLVARRVREAGAVYVSAEDWVAEDGFADPIHLNGSGAREFTGKLAVLVRQSAIQR